MRLLAGIATQAWACQMHSKAHTCSVHGNEICCELAAEVVLGVKLLPAAQQSRFMYAQQLNLNMLSSQLPPLAAVTMSSLNNGSRVAWGFTVPS